MKQYSRIFTYLRGYKGKIGLYFLCTLLSIFFSIVSIGMLMPFLDLIFTNPDPACATCNMMGKHSGNAVIDSVKSFLNTSLDKNGKITTLGIICVLMVIFIILKNLFLYLSYYILNPLKNKIVNHLRLELYNKILHLPIGYFTEKRKGDLISRITNDVNEVEGSVVSTLEGWVRDPLTIIINFTVLFYISPQLTFFILLCIPIIGFVLGRITRSLKKQSNEVAIKHGESVSPLHDGLSDLRV